MKVAPLTLICSWTALAAVSLAGPAELKLKSPDGKLVWTLSAENGKAWQSLAREGRTVLEKGQLGLVVDGKALSDEVEGWELVDSDPVRQDGFVLRGKHDKGSVTFSTYVVEDNARGMKMMVRMFNNGVAFSYACPSRDTAGKDSVRVTDELTAFRFPSDAVLWTQDSTAALGPCEGVWSPSKIEDFTPDKSEPRSYIRTAPITVELPGGGYAFIQEAGNFGRDWSGIKFALADGQCKTTYFQDPEGFTVKLQKESGYTPWRVILVTDNLNDLVNSDVIDSLAPAPDKKLFPQGPATSWIKPGRSSWTWWDSMSAKNDDQYRFVDMASEFGWEYHLVDEGWKKWDADYAVCLKEMKKLSDYAAKKKVGIWAWLHWSHINNPDNDWQQMRTFIDDMKKAGVKGLKVDFMDSASQDRLRFYDAMLLHTARGKMMINFHGANTPGGESRTWPHELDREGIYGGEQNLWATLGAEHLCALPFTRLVSGYADFTGGYFGHGPKLKGSSWTMQMAANIIYTSPILHWVGNPADMHKAFPAGSPERKLIETIPSTWDETLVLPDAKIGVYAPFARRHGNQWFVALLNGTEKREQKISLSFLKPGTYKAVILSDLADKNDGWKVDVGTVTDKDSIDFSMRPTGGGIAWFVPAQ